jgi:hypothetical protein
MVNVTRPQNPFPNACATRRGDPLTAAAAANTMATAVRASAKASGNQRSNQSEQSETERREP